MSAGYRVAVVGATGAVGTAIRRLLAERRFPAAELVPFASQRSAGRTLDDGLVCQPLRDDAVAGFELAIFSAGASVSREWAPRFATAGALVVDNSSCWRMDPEVPLVVNEVNADALASIPKGIVANPNCTTMVCMLPLKALHDAFGLRAFTATSFQAAGGAGQKGMDELAAQVAPLHAARERLVDDGAAAARLVEHAVHENTLAFNVVPLLGRVVDERGYTDEELKLVHESRKILALPALEVAPTCVRVPVMVGHAIEIRASFAAELDLPRALGALRAFPNLVVEHAPTPLEWAGRPETAVGRVRPDLDDPRALNLFVVGDNLLKGAALNALQIAEALHARGLLGARAAA